VAPQGDRQGALPAERPCALNFVRGQSSSALGLVERPVCDSGERAPGDPGRGAHASIGRPLLAAADLLERRAGAVLGQVQVRGRLVQEHREHGPWIRPHPVGGREDPLGRLAPLALHRTLDPGCRDRRRQHAQPGLVAVSPRGGRVGLGSADVTGAVAGERAEA
jgi:hypothetical protein